MPATAKRPHTAMQRPRSAKRPRFENLAELLDWLGVSADRVVYDPAPGHATRRDLIRFHETSGRRHELVSGVLVENTMGSPESYVAVRLGMLLGIYLEANDVGFLCGADNLVSLSPDQVRGPDLTFVSWARRPERTVPLTPISNLIPDLVAEVISPGNTPREIALKLSEYFTAGVRLAWTIEPRDRTANVYKSADMFTTIDEAGTLDGGDVLPGFRLPLAKLFERLEKPAPAKKPRKKK